MKKRLKYIIFPLITIILEILPYGAVCNFANSNGDPFRETYSYFSLVPFGYANFSPLLTALISCIILIFVFVFFFTGKSIKIIKNFLVLAVILSLCPLLFGITYFSVVAALITATFILELLLIKFA